MQETLVQGSKTLLVSPGNRQAIVPVDVPVRRLEDPMETALPHCRVYRTGMEYQTCHVCEDGHHVHISWVPGPGDL